MCVKTLNWTLFYVKAVDHHILKKEARCKHKLFKNEGLLAIKTEKLNDQRKLLLDDQKAY